MRLFNFIFSNSPISMHDIILAFGSNLSIKTLSKKQIIINSAIEICQKLNKKIHFKGNHSSIKDNEAILSPLYESDAWPNNNDPTFINACMLLRSEIKILELIDLTFEIEKKFKRERIEKNAPRSLDIDIISYDNYVINFSLEKGDFHFPHKEMHKRDFVLYPLNDIYPNFIHPIDKQNFSNLLRNIKSNNCKIIKD